MNDTPSHDTIAAMLPTLLASSACPLCGQSGFHEHSAAEILIYRNGVKYGRGLATAPWTESVKVTRVERGGGFCACVYKCGDAAGWADRLCSEPHGLLLPNPLHGKGVER